MTLTFAAETPNPSLSMFAWSRGRTRLTKEQLKMKQQLTCGVWTSHKLALMSVLTTTPSLSTSLMVGFTGTPSTAAPTCQYSASGLRAGKGGMQQVIILCMSSGFAHAACMSSCIVYKSCVVCKHQNDHVCTAHVLIASSKMKCQLTRALSWPVLRSRYGYQVWQYSSP